MPYRASSPRSRRSLSAPVAVVVLTLAALLPAVAIAQPESSAPRDFQEIRSGVAIFVATVIGDREDLWRTDGTALGTTRLEACPNGCPGGGTVAGSGDGLGFAWLNNNAGGVELWATDGTQDGTRRLTDFRHVTRQHFPRPGLWHAASGNFLFAVYENGTDSLWATDGTPAGTRRLLRQGPENLVEAGPQVFFTTPAEDELRTRLWRTDGTPEGTVSLAIYGPKSQGLARVGEEVVFLTGGQVDASTCFQEVWTSDGTVAGTGPIRRFDDTACFSQPVELVEAAGRAWFPSRFLITDAELWATDGTAAGTLAVSDFTRPDPFLGPFRLVASGDQVFFNALEDGVGVELWVTDGTPGSVRLVADLCPGSCTSQPHPSVAVDGGLLFFSGDALDGYKPWLTDGTAAGTRQLGPAGLYGGFDDVLVHRGRVYYAGWQNDVGTELWAVQPLPGISQRLTSFAPPQALSSTLGRFAGPVGTQLVFAADDGVHGLEPWITDGTVAGTRLLRDLTEDDLEGTVPATPRDLVVRPSGLGGVEVEWSPTAGALAYDLEIRTPFGTETVRWDGVEPRVDFPGLPAATPVSARVRAVNDLGASPFSAQVNGAALPAGAAAGKACEPGLDVLCLQEGRFAVRVHWRNQHAGPEDPPNGYGRALQAEGSALSGYFWFFNPQNVELIVKVLDGTTVNGFQWVFYGALSNVEYWVTVLDTTDLEARTYHNPPGEICGRGDTTALGGSVLAAARSAASLRMAPFTGETRRIAGSVEDDGEEPPSCVADDTTLCLLDGRFQVRVDWRNQHAGNQGVGRAIPFVDRTGFFWFFNPQNVELVAKMLDGRPVNGNFWVFYGALSNVGYTLTVTDTQTGASQSYVNAPGNLCGEGDTEAFPPL